MAQLINTALAEGTFDGVGVDATTELSVELSALDITKRADKEIWVKDELEYTIEVKNIDERDPDDPTDPGLPVVGVTVTDTIDPTIARLITSSVEINGNPAIENTDFTYNPTTGLLTVFLEDLPVGESHIISFRVEKVV